jgi:hypothetical protein
MSTILTNMFSHGSYKQKDSYIMGFTVNGCDATCVIRSGLKRFMCGFLGYIAFKTLRLMFACRNSLFARR